MQTIQIGKGWFDDESGGLNRYYADLLRQLPLVGVGVTGFVAGTDDVAERSDGVVHAFASSTASLPLRLAAVRARTRTALRGASDRLLVGHFALYAAPCLDLVREGRFVVHFHGPWADESRAEGAGRAAASMKQWLERRVYARAARVIVLSRAFGRVLEEQHRVDPARIHVVPGGVDTARFDTSLSMAEARQHLGWPADRPIALVVRRLVRRMGLEKLIAAVARARVTVPDLLVLIAGKGRLTDELAERIKEAGVGAHVRLLGYVPDEQLPLAYRAATFSIVPSVALEGFGLIVAESLAAGTPVLVTDVGGLPETIEHLAPQCIVREPDADALASAIAKAARGQMALPSAAACVRHARERFDWSTVAGRVRAAYTEAMAC